MDRYGQVWMKDVEPTSNRCGEKLGKPLLDANKFDPLLIWGVEEEMFLGVYDPFKKSKYGAQS